MQNEKLETFITLALARINKDQRVRGQLHIDQIEEITLLTVTVHDATKMYMFHQGIRVYSYWLTREERAPLVKRLYLEGMTYKRVGEFLGFHASTIASDVRAMITNGELNKDDRLKKADISKELRLPSLAVVDNNQVKRTGDLRDFAFGKLQAF